MAEKVNQINGLEPVVCKTPTGQIIKTTRKIFESIYVDKGFVIADRGNVADGLKPTGRRSGEPRRHEPTSTIGSAADIAAGLGLEKKSGDAGVMTVEQAGEKHREIEARNNAPSATPDSTLSAPETENANATDIDGATSTPERESNKRNRGRNS